VPSRRPPVRGILPVIFLATFTGLPAAADAEGRYERRREKRGETTDTSPKVDAWAFIDDRRAEPLRLSLLVDAWPARRALVPDLLPLTVGVRFDGVGAPLVIRPDRFALSWPGAPAPVRGLTHDQVRAHPEGVRVLRHDLGSSGVTRGAAWSPRSSAIDVRFYSPPSGSIFRNDDARLPAGNWFTALLEFPVPADLDRWSTPFELTLLGDDPAAPPLATVAFRVEPDPSAGQRAFRKARKARQREDAAARKEEVDR
jgi:hypothetical protein